MHLIDTHTHLYLPTFNHDRHQIIQRALEAGIQRFYMPGIDQSVMPDMLATEQAFPACIAMPGLHPCSVNDSVQVELNFVRQCLEQRNWPAIGEIGLDFYWDTQFAEQQKTAFATQMEWALEANLPIVIHTRNAMQETINMVKPFAKKGLRGVFHCFTGSVESAQQIINMGFLLGIGGVVTYKNSGLGETLRNVPLQHLVLETDSPYLTPVPYRGKRNESSYLSFILEKLTEIYQISGQDIARATTAAAVNLYAY